MLGWGPGWLVDPCQVEIQFDDSPPLVRDLGAGEDAELFTDPWYAYNGLAHLFCGHKAVLSGRVILESPQQKSMDHMGIRVTVEEYIHFFDPYVPTRLKNISKIISPPSSVEGKVEYPFCLPLDMIRCASSPRGPFCRQKGEYPNKNCWLNTYNGNSFAIRHMLIVEVLRPWYTFNIYRYRNLSFQMMDAPVLEKIEEKKKQNEGFCNETSVLKNQLKPDNPHDAPLDLADMSFENDCIVPEVVYVEGLQGHGKCSLHLHSTQINLARPPRGYHRGGAAGDGGVLRGSLLLSDLSEAIISAKIMLIRAEYVGSDSTHDSIEFEHALFGISLDESENCDNGRIPRSKGYLTRKDTHDKDDKDNTNLRFFDPVMKGTTICFEVNFDGPGRDSNLFSIPSRSVSSKFSSADETHEMRLQKNIWSNVSYQLYPTFYYLPLDMTEESGAGSVMTDSSGDIQSSLETNYGKDSKASIFKIYSDESVCLRYFLRVVVQEESGKKLWDTKELTFYYNPHKEILSKVSFLSARNNQNPSVLPPFLRTLDRDNVTEKCESV